MSCRAKEDKPVLRLTITEAAPLSQQLKKHQNKKTTKKHPINLLLYH